MDFYIGYYKNTALGYTDDINVCVFLDNSRTFEVIDEIDIDSIEKLEENSIIYNHQPDHKREQKMRNTINILIRSVKQLKSEIDKLKEGED